MLHSSLGKMVYFASSPICIEERARFKVVTKVDDAQTFRHSLVLSIHRECFIVDHCAEFPNVPLLGIRGGITYNPCLALRQFGYARRDGPHEMLILGLVFEIGRAHV